MTQKSCELWAFSDAEASMTDKSTGNPYRNLSKKAGRRKLSFHPSPQKSLFSYTL
jgi:hypothetical protein